MSKRAANWRKKIKRLGQFFSQKRKTKVDVDFSWEKEVSDESETNFDSEEIFAAGKEKGINYYLIYFFIFAAFALLIFRVFSLQISYGSENLEKSEHNRIRYKYTEATRGLIYDANGIVLARNKPNFTLVAYPLDLPAKPEGRKELYQKISAFSGIDESEIESKIEGKGLVQFDPIIVRENLEREKALILEEKLADIAGFAIEKRGSREYPFSKLISHLIGYTAPLSEADIARYPSYLLLERVGKVGLESSYEEVLRGKNGKELIEVDAAGDLKRYIAKEEAVSGESLELYLDINLQKAATRALKKSLLNSGSRKGVAIVMDPRNGGIKAFVSLPAFDSNIFTQKKSQKLYQDLLRNPDKPLFNRAISGVYPSGSTIKPIVATAGLSEGVITDKTTIFDKGQIEVPNKYNPREKYIYKDWKAHGWVDVYKAIAVSCNVFFYHVGGGFGHIKGLGLERLVSYYRKFGLGEKTGIDLENEAEGLVPDEEWKLKNKGKAWFLGDTYLLSIGQGNLLVTPLQLTVATSAIANGGKLLKPKIVKRILGQGDKVVRKLGNDVKRENLAPAKYLAIVRAGMRGGVTYGSSRSLSNLPFSVAGKTGTAETGKKGEKNHAWYTCFAPYNNPEIVVTVLVENGGEGYEAAVPVAREILKSYFASKSK